MTEYFEVLDRDGAARRGELRLDSPRPTPALVDDVLEDAGSLWVNDRAVPEGDESVLTVLPHRAFPSGTPESIQEAFDVSVPDLDAPSAAVVTPNTAVDRGTDAYVLSGSQGSVGHGRAFVDAIVETRSAIPDDAALYLPGVATPANAALLAYAGIDLVDADRAVIAGRQGRYLLTDGAFDLEDLDELPCPCPACETPLEDFDREACVEHNTTVLESELSRVRQRIRNGRLREYLEGQARQTAWVTAALRLLDRTDGYLAERTPIYRDQTMLASTEDALHRPEIRRFADRVTHRYERRIEDVPLLLLPCSAKKPYSESQSHRQFQ
ncbi:MAG: DUF5591 domain-containing protein, partial [Halodesulfurarchaeum sp.]